MVSTDSEEIAAVAREYGADVPFMRSRETSDDYATTNDVLVEVFNEYSKRGEHYDIAVCIYPTAPFVTADKLKNAVVLMERDGVEAVTPGVMFSFPPPRAFVIRDSLLEYQYPEYAKMRSQDLEPVYHDCGQFYAMKVKNVLQGIAVKAVPVIVPETEVQDIDCEEDWVIAEMKYRAMTKV